MTTSHLLAAAIDDQAPAIDLHQMDTVALALEMLEREIFELYKNSERYCRVIYGGGSGVLGEAVRDALSQNPLVDQWEIEMRGASCVVSLIQK